MADTIHTHAKPGQGRRIKLDVKLTYGPGTDDLIERLFAWFSELDQHEEGRGGTLDYQAFVKVSATRQEFLTSVQS